MAGQMCHYCAENLSLKEKDLILGCIREDQTCQKLLFEQFAPKMFTVCRRYARHHMEAEDMLQDGFVKVFDNLKQFQGKGSFEGWVRRIMVNTALKYYRKSSFQKEQIGFEDYQVGTVAPEALSSLGEEEIMALIANLPDGYRVVFNLYVLEGYSHQEIAKELNIAESTSRSQLVKARKMLQSRVLQSLKIRI